VPARHRSRSGEAGGEYLYRGAIYWVLRLFWLKKAKRSLLLSAERSVSYPGRSPRESRWQPE
jgi:hypothetical protein